MSVLSTQSSEFKIQIWHGIIRSINSLRILWFIQSLWYSTFCCLNLIFLKVSQISGPVGFELMSRSLLLIFLHLYTDIYRDIYICIYICPHINIYSYKHIRDPRAFGNLSKWDSRTTRARSIYHTSCFPNPYFFLHARCFWFSLTWQGWFWLWLCLNQMMVLCLWIVHNIEDINHINIYIDLGFIQVFIIVIC